MLGKLAGIWPEPNAKPVFGAALVYISYVLSWYKLQAKYLSFMYLLELKNIVVFLTSSTLTQNRINVRGKIYSLKK